jgi:hypothetical protein
VKTYCLLTSVSPSQDERIVVFLDMDAEKMQRGKVLCTLGAAIHMHLEVMCFVLVVGGEINGISMWRERAMHRHGPALGLFC